MHIVRMKNIMRDFHPLITVIMAVKNEELYIEEALRSIVNQTYRHFEVIVIDDNSTDATFQIVSGILKMDNRISLYRSCGNGKVAAFNMGWSISKGEYIFLFGGDDILTNDSLAIRVSLHGLGADVATGRLRCFSDIRKYNNIVLPKRNRPSLKGGVTSFSRNFASLLFPIPIDLPSEDTWTSLCIKMFAKKIKWTNDVVLRYRIHENNSVRMGVCYEEKSKIISDRRKAYDYFLETFRDVLNEDSAAYISSLIRAEKYRIRGRWEKILLSDDISFREKMNFISYSNKLLYQIRTLFERFLIGL